MSTQVRPAPPALPFHGDTSGSEERRARRLWERRAGVEASEDEVIEMILDVEAANVKPRQLRGAHRADAKATLSWLLLTGVLVRLDVGRFKFASEFPTWPTRTRQQIQRRDEEMLRQERQREIERVEQHEAEVRQRHRPRDAELEQRLAAVETGQAEMRLEMRSLARRADDGDILARAEAAKQRAAANRRDTTDLPDDAGEEVVSDVHDNPERP